MTAGGESWWRAGVVTVGTCAVAALLFGALMLLPPFGRAERVRPPPPAAMEAGLVELPTPAPAASVQEPPQAEAVPPPPSSFPTTVPPALPQPRAEPAPKPRTAKPRPRPDARAKRPEPAAVDDAPAPATEVPPAATETSSSAPVKPAPDDGLPGGTGAARAIFQPLPEIPSDLRHRRLALVAVVRFSIARDGSATAELEEATPDPQLNRILLDAFRRWRFFPALQDGKPTASTLTLRVPLTVE